MFFCSLLNFLNLNYFSIYFEEFDEGEYDEEEEVEVYIVDLFLLV